MVRHMRESKGDSQLSECYTCGYEIVPDRTHTCSECGHCILQEYGHSRRNLKCILIAIICSFCCGIFANNYYRFLFLTPRRFARGDTWVICGAALMLANLVVLFAILMSCSTRWFSIKSQDSFVLLAALAPAVCIMNIVAIVLLV